MAAYNTVYTDPNGNKKTGYIVNGVTYQDQAGTTPIEVGSKVTTADGKTYYKNAGGSEDISAYGELGGALYQQSNNANRQAQDSLQKAQEQQDTLIQARTDAAVKQLQAQVTPLNQQYNQQKTANYRDYVLGQDSLKDQLAAAGLSTSGASESSRVAMNADYMENQNTTEQARQNAMQNIQDQITQARLSGDYAAAEQLASYYQQLASLQQSTASDNANTLLSAYQLQQAADQTAYERTQTADQTAYAKAQSTAETLAAYGDFSGYKALGYTDAQIANMSAAYNAQVKAQSSGSSGSGTAYFGLGDYAQTLLGLWSNNTSFDLAGGLASALAGGLITQKDYIAALQVAGAMGYGQTPAASQPQKDTSVTATYIRGLGGNYTPAQLRQLLNAGKIRVTETDGNANPINYEWVTGVTVTPGKGNQTITEQTQ